MYMQVEVLDLPNMVFDSIKCFNKCLGAEFAQKKPIKIQRVVKVKMRF